ncbi:MAG TPA: hypothetical protein VMT10_10245 [Solirubrobacteraceae bacterium]|nr:hypothetical protein [Solirubrobacteraceae bacterium]
MRGAAPLAAALVLLALAPGARAAAAVPSSATAGAASVPVTRTAMVAPVPGARVHAVGPISETRATAIAAAVPKIAAEHRRYPGSTFDATRKDAARWEVNLWSRATKGHPQREIGQVEVAVAGGKVLEAWTGFQVAWTMARGYPGAFGKSVNTAWLWVTLCALFVLPFVDVRRPLRMLHLDLLALVGFSVSLAFFNHANLGMSVPLTYPLLAYLCARLLWVGLRRRPAASPPLQLLVPWQWLAVATLFLIGFRIGLNIVDGNVIDVGYAGVIGADKIMHGQALYGAFPHDNDHGDTYGPLLYLAYIPFELIWPWHGTWDDLPAAHAAAGAFDMACVGLLFLIGRSMRDTALGVVFAYGWVAYPFTIFATNSGTNDALPAALLLAALLLHRRPLARGALIAAAGMAKFAQLGLLPLFAAHDLGPPGRGRARRVAAFSAGAAIVIAASMALVLAKSDLRTFWDHTIAYQASRSAPFSVWGFYGGGWHVAQHVVQAFAVVLAVGVAFIPRRDDLVGLAALSGAILLAFQLSTTYWFYLYLVWVVPVALIALIGRLAVPAPVTQEAPSTAPAAARSPAPAMVPSTG